MTANASMLSAFFGELQRRHVYKVGAAYAVGGWLLVQIVTQVLPIFHVGETVQRIIVVAIVAGFPAALVLAWIFDLTPRGIVRTAELPPAGEAPATIRERRGAERTLNYLLGALLMFAVGYVALEHFVFAPRARVAQSDSSADKSVAVLPLVNTGGDPANEYFSDGLSEELIAVLAKIPDLKVVGRSSSFRFKNSNEDGKAIGAALGVAHLLEGSVRRQGSRVRIVAELVAADGGRELWSETYDRELKDVFAVQSEIAVAVAEQLKVRLTGNGAQPRIASSTTNLAAYNALLQGDFYRAHFTFEDARKAAGFYDEAVRLDPGYALGYARVSGIWRGLAASWLEASEIEDAYARSSKAALKAVALAPDSSDAHLALALLSMTPAHDFATAEAEFRRALALAPADARVRDGYAYLLAAEGRLTDAEAMTREVIALDPLAVTPYLNLARIFTTLGRLDEAEAALRKTIALQPGASHQYVYLVTVDLLRGDAAAAQRDAALEGEGFWGDYAQALALQTQPQSDAAVAAVQRFIETRGRTGAFQVAALYGLRREPEPMFQWLDRAYAANDSGLTQLFVTPFFAPYRSDPRFIAIVRKLKLDPGLPAASS